VERLRESAKHYGMEIEREAADRIARLMHERDVEAERAEDAITRALRAEAALAAAQKDAERYRHIRKEHGEDAIHFDAAIDAARGRG
jgi:hypothetical protein